jgi:hypothetical protein
LILKNLFFCFGQPRAPIIFHRLSAR